MKRKKKEKYHMTNKRKKNNKRTKKSKVSVYIVWIPQYNRTQSPQNKTRKKNLELTRVQINNDK